MLSAILIDDENLAIRELKALLQEFSVVQIVGTFTDAAAGLEEAARLCPDVVFLDIDMPQFTGMQIAALILERCPSTSIVFVTAHDTYAVEAFELQAEDYLLKPVDEPRLTKTIERLQVRRELRAQHQEPERRLQIRCFGGFQAGWPEETPIKWRSAKTKELFAYLVHHQGTALNRDVILDAIWPCLDAEKAARHLHNAVYYTRKALGDYGVEQVKINASPSYCLELGVVGLDLEEFRRTLDCDLHSMSRHALETAAAVYTGEYLAAEDYSWANVERLQFARHYSELMMVLSLKCEQDHDVSAAIETLTKAYAYDPLEERITETLLELYERTGRTNRLMKHYKEYKKIVRKELQAEPGEPIQTIYSRVTKRR